ncbi:hypothetical protein LO80_07065 [Candidatus Francisella endociliophora]|uniref:Uncharacterized protein n=1 Tax=Candidatus Francisella endociliophora TaxID=653937 RepID=A0A097EQA2_9GAMM|nr:hypothetical protein [Francisella sp. FSC1006]AIT09748.1 hypothetical protein LO80_07065 [Francisella sp. FSC1006]
MKNKIISNSWLIDKEQNYKISQILHNDKHPEGLDLYRYQVIKTCCISLSENGHILSMIKGNCKLVTTEHNLSLETGTHIYIPAETDIKIHAELGSEFILVSSPTKAQASGTDIIIRKEKFICSSALSNQMFRWILTPQYLSRRIFLFHDKTLLSKAGVPISWFRTTMFDVTGLPTNQDGTPVFKMSYNNHTEPNICYDIKGKASVRMAEHPYTKDNQKWLPWISLDNDSTYYLDETLADAEWVVTHNKEKKPLRNKHEVFIEQGGHVSLFCIFDPAPTGSERHSEGEYSEYQPLNQVVNTKAYDAYLSQIKTLDQAIDSLSLADARGEKPDIKDFNLYQQGINEQKHLEKSLFESLTNQGAKREKILRHWMI